MRQPSCRRRTAHSRRYPHPSSWYLCVTQTQNLSICRTKPLLRGRRRMRGKAILLSLLLCLPLMLSATPTTASSPELSPYERGKALAEALSNEEVRRLFQSLIAEGYTPRMEAVEVVYLEDEEGVYCDVIMVLIPFTTPAEDPGKFDFETASDCKVLVIAMRGEGMYAYIRSKHYSSICQNPRNNNNPVLKTCTGFSYCDRLFGDDYPGEGTYCKSPGEGVCTGRSPCTHYHEYWWIYDPGTGYPIEEWHTSLCDEENGPCGQSDCYQTEDDKWLPHCAPGCWDSNDGWTSGWQNESATDCCWKITSCSC